MMTAHRRLLLAVIILVTLLLQVGVAGEISVGSVKPDILLTATICWALFEGPTQGALFGFWGGLLEDVFTIAVLGVGAFAKTLIGYFSGEIKQRVVSKSVVWPMLIVFAGTLFHELIKFASWTMVGLEQRPSLNAGVVFGLALYNAVLTLAVYPLLGRFASREEREMLF